MSYLSLQAGLESGTFAQYLSKLLDQGDKTLAISPPARVAAPRRTTPGSGPPARRWGHFPG